MIVLADATWLEGSVVVPFPYVSAAVGLVILAVLVYFARK